MTPKEKRLIRWAMIIFMVFAMVQLFPTTEQWIRDYWQHIQNLQNDIENSQKLEARTQYWQAENDRAKQKLLEVTQGLLEGENTQLVGANLQKLISDTARRSGVAIRSMDPPKIEVSKNEQWLLVIQLIQLDTDSKNLMTFLNGLTYSNKKLVISSLTIRTAGSKLNVSLQITGFSQPNPTDNPPPLINGALTQSLPLIATAPFPHRQMQVSFKAEAELTEPYFRYSPLPRKPLELVPAIFATLKS